MNRKAAKLVKDLIRNPYAFPGGYPKFAITSDGCPICHKCCKDEFRQIVQSTSRDGWEIVAIDINYEDKECYCDNCGKKIECAYE